MSKNSGPTYFAIYAISIVLQFCGVSAIGSGVLLAIMIFAGESSANGATDLMGYDVSSNFAVIVIVCAFFVWPGMLLLAFGQLLLAIRNTAINTWYMRQVAQYTRELVKGQRVLTGKIHRDEAQKQAKRDARHRALHDEHFVEEADALRNLASHE